MCWRFHTVDAALQVAKALNVKFAELLGQDALQVVVFLLGRGQDMVDLAKSFVEANKINSADLSKALAGYLLEGLSDTKEAEVRA